MSTSSFFLRQTPNTRPHIRWCTSMSPPQMQGTIGSSHLERALRKLRVMAGGGSGQITQNNKKNIPNFWPERKFRARNSAALSYCHQLLCCPNSTCILSCLFVILPRMIPAFLLSFKAIWLSTVMAIIIIIFEASTWNPAKPNIYRARQHVVSLQVWHRKREGVCANGRYNRDDSQYCLILFSTMMKIRPTKIRTHLNLPIWLQNIQWCSHIPLTLLLILFFSLAIGHCTSLKAQVTGTFACYSYG